MSRSWQTINHPGNARTGTRAFGPTPRRGFGLRRARHAILSDAGGSATTEENHNKHDQSSAPVIWEQKFKRLTLRLVSHPTLGAGY